MIFLHGSYDPHPEGRRLTPVPDSTAIWEAIPFVQVLERYRPDWGIPHAEAVFLCEDPDHLDPCGAPPDHVVEVSPEGPSPGTTRAGSAGSAACSTITGPITRRSRAPRTPTGPVTRTRTGRSGRSGAGPRW